jgi:transcriptional regulator with XRE-family HTH domain
MNEFRKYVVGPGEIDNFAFGELLAAVRVNSRLTKPEAAKRLSVSPEYIRLIEKGERTPAFGTTIEMLEVFSEPYETDDFTIILPQFRASIEFTSRIKKSRKISFDLSREEMIVRIMTALVFADDNTLKKIYRGVSKYKESDATTRQHCDDGRCQDHIS